MDNGLDRIETQYPNSKYVLIPKYEAAEWEGKEYDSSKDNKIALNRWSTNPLSFEKAKHMAEEGYRIGWVIPKNYVVVDIDNTDNEKSQKKIEDILNAFEVAYSYNYTSRGVHLLFKDTHGKLKSDSHIKCGLNITIDTRANGTGYIILPVNDPHREWGDWPDVIEEIPYFLKPVGKINVPSFIDMKEGDGRNTALFKWRLTLQSKSQMDASEIEKTIRVINERLFSTPMSNQELFKTVLRDIEDPVKEKEQKQNIYNKYAEEIISKYDLICSYGTFYLFNGIYYKKQEDIDIEKIIHYEISNNLSSAARKEIIEFLKLKTNVSIDNFDSCWYKIACANGIINLVTGELEEPNKQDLNTIYIPIEYNMDPVYSPRIDEFMKQLTNADAVKINFLYQIAGYCLLKRNLFEKFFICVGEGGTGKSTYTNLLMRLVGGDNCSHIGLAEFDKDYYLSTLQGKLLNIDDDVVDGKMLENTGRFKSIISGNVISVRQIYREVVSMKPYATCVFSCNRLPRIMDKTTGLYRRMILIELNNKVQNPDPLFMSKVTDIDMQYLLFKAVEAIKIAIEEGHFRINYSEIQLLETFKRRQSPLNEWLYTNMIALKDIVGANCASMYRVYSDWCVQNGYNKISAIYSFKEDICALYDVEVDLQSTTDSKLPRQVFVKRGQYDENFRPF